jgi:two-component system LytT family response regulator
MKCIIIDDEKHCIKTLSSLMEKYYRDIQIAATCLESTKAYDLILENRPDFIFLDIEMPLLNGFDLLSKFDHLDFDVIPMP